MWRLMVLVSLVAASVGCVTVETTTFRQPAGQCQAEILHVPPQAGAYEEIGYIKGVAGALAGVEAARDALRERACAAGADAIYVSYPAYPTCSFNIIQPMSADGVLLKRKAAPAVADAAPAPMAN